jgi:hypothetical protein
MLSSCLALILEIWRNDAGELHFRSLHAKQQLRPKIELQPESRLLDRYKPDHAFLAFLKTL